MSWLINDNQGSTAKFDRESMIAMYHECPDLVAIAESGFEVELDDLCDEPEQMADSGYGDRDSRRIVLWESEDESEDDAGANAFASIVWAGPAAPEKDYE